MRRRLFKLALALTYLLFGASILIYVHSYHADQVVFVRSSRIGGSIPPLAQPLASANESMIRRFDSEFAHDTFQSYWSNTRYELHFSRGRIAYTTVSDFCLPAPPYDRQPIRLGRAGFCVGHFHSPPTDINRGIANLASYKSSLDRGVLRVYLHTLPLGWIVIVASILPACHALKRMRCTPAGKCPVCLYNLTGNNSGVCPECGTAIKSTFV